MNLVNTNNEGKRMELAAAICWQLWKSRNRKNFDGKDADPKEIIDKAHAQCQEWFQNQEASGQPVMHSSNRFRTWQLPNRSQVKVNCDATFDISKKEAQIAFICRNQNGEI